MKRIAWMVLCLAACSGCVAAGAIDEQVQKLTNQIAEERKRGEESLRADFARDLASAQDSLRSEYARKLEELKKELDLQREVHQKDVKDVNLTLIKVQGDFYDNRRVTEDSARRVYILESLIAATRPVAEERSDGIVLYSKDGSITTNLGTRHGVKAGDVLSVFRDQAFREKVGSVKVLVAEGAESKGEAVEKSASIATGNFVKVAR